MAKFVSINRVDGKIVNYTYAAKDGKTFTATYEAVAMAMADGHDDCATLREAMALNRQKRAQVAPASPVSRQVAE